MSSTPGGNRHSVTRTRSFSIWMVGTAAGRVMLGLVSIRAFN